MFKVNNKANKAVLVALLLTLNLFHTFLLMFLLLTLNMQLPTGNYSFQSPCKVLHLFLSKHGLKNNYGIRRSSH